MKHIRSIVPHLQTGVITCTLLSLMVGILGFTGYFLGGTVILISTVVAAFAIAFIYPMTFHPIILKLYQVKSLHYDEVPLLYNIMTELSKTAGLKRLPALYLYPGQIMNAFIYGVRGDQMIAFSDKMLNYMNLNEIYGVMAHEICHIKNKDMNIMAFTEVIIQLTRILSVTGQISLFFNLPLIFLGKYDVSFVSIVIVILAPRINILFQHSLSRIREYYADSCAVRLLKSPDPIYQALKKIQRFQEGRVCSPVLQTQTCHKEMAFIQTHPLTRERILRLDFKNSFFEEEKENRDKETNAHFLFYQYSLKSSDTP